MEMSTRSLAVTSTPKRIDHLLERASHEGYAAYVSLAGFLMVMPVALLR